MVYDPTVSVIVPMFNAARTIGGCVRSILACDYPCFEVIVVDDNSSDGSASIAAGLPCVLVRLGTQLGPGAARNEGARRAIGEILAFTDADCEVSRDWLRKLTSAFKQDDVGGVTGGYAGMLNKGLLAVFQFYDTSFRQRNTPQNINSCVTSNFACRKVLFEEIGGFLLQYRGEDTRFGFALSERAKILWDRSNGVFHHFGAQVIPYFMKQISWAEAVVKIFLTDSSAIGKQCTWRNQEIIIHLFSTILIWACLIEVAWYPALYGALLVFTFIYALVNINFIIFVAREKGIFISLKIFPFLLARNTAWLVGIAKAILAYVVQPRLTAGRKRD